jgi:hypothetical protein
MARCTGTERYRRRRRQFGRAVSVLVRWGRGPEQHDRSGVHGARTLERLVWRALWAQLGTGLYYSFGPGPDKSF